MIKTKGTISTTDRADRLITRNLGVETASSAPAIRTNGSGSSRSKSTAETASNYGQSYNLGLPAGSSTSNIQVPQSCYPLLDGFMPEEGKGMPPILLNNMFREIYRSDPICGSAIDMMSTFPFSDFVLTGLHNEKRLSKYAQSVESLRLRQLLPTLSVDFLTLGKFIGTLSWDDTRNIYSAISPHNCDFVNLEVVPVYGVDPIMRLTLPSEVLKLINSGRPEVKKVLERLPEGVLETMTKAGVVLDPESTIFIPRQGLISDYGGVSLLKRVLPTWLMEKALIRGTLDQFWKRQRAIMHITIGDEGWEPVQADFQSTNDLFLAADHDPTGAIVTTRQSVNVNEVRRGDDFLKWGDQYDVFERAKLRAMGIGDLLQGGDAQLSVAEGQVSIMMQYFENYRSMITREVFYDKIFPAIALANNFKRSQTMVLGSEEMEGGAFEGRGMRHDSQGRLYAEFSAELPEGIHTRNMSQYAMPKVKWLVSLKADGTSQYMDMLEKLEAKGVPVALRQWAAAAGLTLDQIAEEEESDVRIRKHFKKWRKIVAKTTGDPSSMMDGDDDAEEANVFEGASILPGMGSTGPRVGLMNRAFREGGHEPFQLTKNGKPTSMSPKARRAFNKDMNLTIAKAVAKNLKEKQRRDNAEFKRDTSRKTIVSFSKPKA